MPVEVFGVGMTAKKPGTSKVPPPPLATTSVAPTLPSAPMQTYRKAKVSWFRSKDDPNRHLSNLCGSHPIYWPLERETSNCWCSTEQLYHACKYPTSARKRLRSRMSAESHVRARIRMQKTPRAARVTQLNAQALIRPDWDAPNGVKLSAMLWVLELKFYFNHHRPFGRELIATGNRPIVEVSADDDFWGAKEVSLGVFVGHNHLGRLLMEVRARAAAILAGDLTYPEGFLLP